MGTPGGEKAAEPTPRRRRPAPHLLAGGVFVLIAAVSVTAALGLRQVVHNQERRLLDERGAELAAYLKATTEQTSAMLRAAGEAVAADGARSPLFGSLAGPLTVSGRTVAVARRSQGHFVTVAALGRLATPGERVGAVEESVLRRAVTAKGLVYTVRREATSRRFVEGLRVSGARPTVVYLVGVLPLAPATVATTKDSPYRELDVALYTGSKEDPDNLVLISGARPDPDRDPIRIRAAIGSDKILIVTAAHDALVGSFTQAVPWLVLVGGLLLAALVAILVQVLGRRRAYALNLVEQRTRALHQAQLAAEAANRSKSEFLSRMSHELRTPLNAVLGFSQLLELDELTRDQEQAVKQITKGGRHLLDLINEILDISRIETGSLALSPEAVRVDGLVAETLELLRPLAEERGINLRGGDAGQDVVFADRQRLKQILLNLVGNGIKYNREGGTVSIGCTRPSPGTVRIEVDDTGTGIAQEHFGLLFTPFERLGAEQTSIEGTGIGLALSLRLAEAMGGTMGVESDVGRGSTFWVDLPAVEDPVERVERLGHVGPAHDDPPAPDRPAVLHIEDNVANAQLIERVLAQRPGVRLIPAMQGRLGVELARQHRPALILLDLNLADVPGEEILRALRDDPATARIPVAIVSADAMPRQVQRLLAAGATAYLTKPIDVRQLLELIDDALATYVAPAATPAAAPRPPAGPGG